jgi:hypothetical protein
VAYHRPPVTAPTTTRPSAADRWAVALEILVVVALVACAAYEVGVALGALSLGSAPGEGPPGGDAVLAVALLALLLGGLLSLAHRSGRFGPGAAAALLGPAAVAFVAARFYSYDPYYAPTLRRMSDGGATSPTWIFLLIAIAPVAAVLTRIRPRIGQGITAVLLVLCFVTAWLEDTGH